MGDSPGGKPLNAVAVHGIPVINASVVYMQHSQVGQIVPNRMDENIEMSTAPKGRNPRGSKKTELQSIDNAEMARIVDPESESEEQYVFSYSLRVVEDETEAEEGWTAQSSSNVSDGAADSGEAGGHLANWGELGQRFEATNAHFSGRPGPTLFGEDLSSTALPASLSEQRKTKLHFFRKFFSSDCTVRILSQTNLYVKQLVSLPRPASLNSRFAWPPKWAMEWEELTEGKLMRWIALLLYMAYHPSVTEADLWLDHWFYTHPGIQRFMTYEEHKIMKAAIHFQSDHENRQDPDTPDLLPKKIGLLMKLVRDNFRLHYSPSEVITIEEFPLLLSSDSLRKPKLAYEGLVLHGISCVQDGLKYIYDVEIDSNDKDHRRLHKAAVRLARKLQRGAGHKIFMSSTFSSVDLFNDIAGLGHFCCGSITSGRGVPRCVMELRQRSGNANGAPQTETPAFKDGAAFAFAMSKQGNLTAYAWPPQRTKIYLSNFHPPVEAKTPVVRREPGRREPVPVRAPVSIADFLRYMEHMEQAELEYGVTGAGAAGAVGVNPLNWTGSDKWYHAVFWFLLDACVCNSMRLWHDWQSKDVSAANTKQEWVAGLCDEILSIYEAAPRADAAAEAAAAAAGGVAGAGGDGGGKAGGGGAGGGAGSGGGRKRRCMTSEARQSHRRLTERHFIESAEKKRNCALCYHTNPHKSGELQVHHWCSACGVHLHIDCFEQWHTKLDPRSKRVTVGASRSSVAPAVQTTHPPLPPRAPLPLASAAPAPAPALPPA